MKSGTPKAVPRDGVTVPPEPLKPCLECGRPPRASLSIGGDAIYGSFECGSCGKRTRDGLTYQDAWLEWNRLQSPGQGGN